MYRAWRRLCMSVGEKWERRRVAASPLFIPAARRRPRPQAECQGRVKLPVNGFIKALVDAGVFQTDQEKKLKTETHLSSVKNILDPPGLFHSDSVQVLW